MRQEHSDHKPVKLFMSRLKAIMHTSAPTPAASTRFPVSASSWQSLAAAKTRSESRRASGSDLAELKVGGVRVWHFGVLG